MPQIIVYLDEKENIKVRDLSRKWNISKHETMKKMVRDFKNEKIKNENKN